MAIDSFADYIESTFEIDESEFEEIPTFWEIYWEKYQTWLNKPNEGTLLGGGGFIGMAEAQLTDEQKAAQDKTDDAIKQWFHDTIAPDKLKQVLVEDAQFIGNAVDDFINEMQVFWTKLRNPMLWFRKDAENERDVTLDVGQVHYEGMTDALSRLNNLSEEEQLKIAQSDENIKNMLGWFSSDNMIQVLTQDAQLVGEAVDIFIADVQAFFVKLRNPALWIQESTTDFTSITGWWTSFTEKFATGFQWFQIGVWFLQEIFKAMWQDWITNLTSMLSADEYGGWEMVALNALLGLPIAFQSIWDDIKAHFQDKHQCNNRNAK